MSIEEHKFKDVNIDYACVDGEGDIEINDGEAYFSKADIIAMAKALNVTGEDLE